MSKWGNDEQLQTPDGSVTENIYSSTNRLLTKNENVTDPNPALNGQTLYKYEYGRLTRMSAKQAHVSGDPLQAVPLPQQTEVEYGAEIVDANYQPMSTNNGLVGTMHLPDESTGIPSTAADVTLRYTYSGQIAERIDGRGVVFRYTYDDLSRLSIVQVGHYVTEVFTAGYPDSMTPLTGAPTDRVSQVEYAYDDYGNLSGITARDELGLIVADNAFEYDLRGMPTDEWQSHGAAVNPLSETRMSYAWMYTPTGAVGSAAVDTGTHRLALMTYPKHGTQTRRQVTLDYGLAGQADDLLGRIAAFTTNLGPATIADFTYFGIGRRSEMFLAGDEITQTYKLGSEVGFAGLDSFGRTADLHYKNFAGQTLFRGEYAFDVMGNRKYARISQAEASGVGGVSQENVRSQLNLYDTMNRLIGTKVGTLNSGGTGLTVEIREDEWQLDLLGNWIGATQAGLPGATFDAGRRSEGNLDGYGTEWAQPGADPVSDIIELLHGINARNELTSITTDDGSVPETVDPSYDPNGNLVFDGQYYHQYDAWNRLVQVNAAHMEVGAVVIDELIKHHTYDGLGRQIRTQSPYQDPSVQTGEVQTERFFYDKELLPARAATCMMGCVVQDLSPRWGFGDAGTFPRG